MRTRKGSKSPRPPSLETALKPGTLQAAFSRNPTFNRTKTYRLSAGSRLAGDMSLEKNACRKGDTMDSRVPFMVVGDVRVSSETNRQNVVDLATQRERCQASNRERRRCVASLVAGLPEIEELLRQDE